MKQTAVQWLVEELNNIKVWTKNDIILQKADILIEQAKEMEKQQIIDACRSFGNLNGVDDSDFEQYYNETFKNK
jgi:hypothetical protein